MTASLSSVPVRAHYTHEMDAQTALRKILDMTPGSIRELAREAGLSEALLRAVRDGDRRLTRQSRDALVDALGRWEKRCGDALEVLEAADLEPPQGGDDGQQ